MIRITSSWDDGSQEVSKNDQWGRLVEFFEMLGQMK